MSFKHSFFLGAVLLCAQAVYGATYFVGADDFPGLDYDYNDVIFSMAGNGLSLHSAGTWFAGPDMAKGSSAFWNRPSLDGPDMNVGYCIYGGGACGAPLASNLKYLTDASASTQKAPGDVFFSTAGTVTLQVAYQFTADQDVLGWYSLSSPGVVHPLNPNANSGTFTFTPGGLFGITLANAQGDLYYSQAKFGTQDQYAHFAFFGTEMSDAPEPGMLALVALGFTALLGFAYRRRTRLAQAR
jgi:hypothetical protein